jgi:tetratricopeptide (TPR) repeat protein
MATEQDYSSDEFTYGESDDPYEDDLDEGEFRSQGLWGMLREAWKRRQRFRGSKRVLFVFALIALFLLGIAERFLSFLLGQPSRMKSMDAFDKAIRKNPKDAKAYFGRALKWVDMGEYLHALDDLDDAIKYGHRSLEVYRCRSQCNTALCLHEELVADYTTMLTYLPEAVSFRGRADAYKELGEWQLAISDYDNAMSLGIRDSTIWVCRADAWYNGQQYDQALDDLRRSLAPESGQLADGYWLERRANLFLDLNCSKEALDDLAEAIRFCSWSDWYHEQRANLLMDLGRTEEANYHYGEMERILRENDQTMADKTPLNPIVREHHGEAPLEEMNVTLRTWPFRAAADLQRAFERLSESDVKLKHFFATQWSGAPVREFTSLYMRDRRNPVIAVPPQYLEFDIGEQQPVRALRDGVWLLQVGQVPLTVILNPEYDGIRIHVAARKSPAALEAARRFYAHLEKAVQRSDCYRGKVLSLEFREMYSGQGLGILVHKLRRVDRAEIILPSATLDLLDRNVMQFIAQRPRLASLGLSIKKGLLLYGPPGTGKTHTIHYLAGTLPQHTTFLISAEQVCNLSEYMTLARLLQPCLIVIEDVDLIARERTEMRSAGEEVLLNKLLNEMDGLRADAEILFVLTTNRPSALEEALASRPGRIDQAIEFPLPDEVGRGRLVRLYSQGVEVPADVMEYSVERTRKVSASFIKELMRRSIQFALLRDHSGPLRLEKQDVEQALNEMLVHGGSLNRKLLGATEHTVVARQ